MDRTVIDSPVDIYQLAFALTVKDIATKRLCNEICDTQFLTNLPKQCLLRGLAVVDMTANGGIPLAGLNVLPVRATLKVEFAT